MPNMRVQLEVEDGTMGGQTGLPDFLPATEPRERLANEFNRRITLR
jgi:hypothetical protein